jgi:hypothetical protein
MHSVERAKADRIDRAAVMIEARRQFSIMGPLGWTFAKCLAYAWSKAKRQRIEGVGARS